MREKQQQFFSRHINSVFFYRCGGGGVGQRGVHWVSLHSARSQRSVRCGDCIANGRASALFKVYNFRVSEKHSFDK